MAASVYKWLIFPALTLTLMSLKQVSDHPLHVSVIEINHNAADKTLEISCKIFTDDFSNGFGEGSWGDAAKISTAEFKTGSKSLGKVYAKGNWHLIGVVNWWPSLTRIRHTNTSPFG